MGLSFNLMKGIFEMGFRLPSQI